MAKFTPKKLVEHFTEKLRSVEPEPLNGFGFLFFSPWDMKRASRELGGVPIESWSWKAHGVQRSQDIDKLFLLSTLIGAPNLAMAVEEYASFGIKKLVVVGYAGGIGADVGSVVVPTWGVVCEGASIHYGKNWEDVVYPSKGLTERLKKSLEKLGMAPIEGGVVSTSSPYRETEEFLDKFKRMGCVAVDMELSAAFTLGEVLGVEVASVLVISDKVHPGEWTPGFFSEAFKKSRRALFSILKELSKEVFFGE